MTTRIRAAIGLLLLSAMLATRAAADSDPCEFRIARQSLAQALMVFSEQSRRVVTASSTLLSGKTAAAIDGRMAPEDALAKLLQGSGLTFVKGPGGDLTIVAVQVTR